MFNEIFSFINMQNPENWLHPGLCHYLIIALFIFLTGLIITISSGNLIKILIGLNFMTNAAVLNFIAANAFINEANAPVTILNSAVQESISKNFAPQESIFFNFSIPEGQAIGLILTIFWIINTIAGLGLILAVYSRFKNINAPALNSLKSADCPDYDDFKTEDDI